MVCASESSSDLCDLIYGDLPTINDPGLRKPCITERAILAGRKVDINSLMMQSFHVDDGGSGSTFLSADSVESGDQHGS